MRLGQLARKLEISPTQIINLLQQKEYSAIEGTNSKLSAEQISLVVQTFYKEPITSEDVTDDVDKKDVSSQTSEDKISEQEVEVVIEAAVQVQAETEVETSETEEDTFTSSDKEDLEKGPEPELIKAPKVSLPGLKVVGKIELPEPKEVEEVDTVVQEPQDEDAIEKKPPARVRGKRKPRPVQNLVAFERSREEKRKRRLRELKEKEAKEKRRKHYEKNFARTVEPTEKVEQQEEIVLEQVEEQKPPSKNWFVRIWRALDAR